MLNVRQGMNEYLRKYLARSNDATIKVTNPNQELFVGAFQHGQKPRQFNESLAQKPAEYMEEIMSRAECYIKGVTQRRKQETSRSGDKKGYYPPPNWDRGTFKRGDSRPEGHCRGNLQIDNFTLLNTRREKNI